MCFYHLAQANIHSLLESEAAVQDVLRLLEGSVLALDHVDAALDEYVNLIKVSFGRWQWLTSVLTCEKNLSAGVSVLRACLHVRLSCMPMTRI